MQIAEHVFASGCRAGRQHFGGIDYRFWRMAMCRMVLPELLDSSLVTIALGTVDGFSIRSESFASSDKRKSGLSSSSVSTQLRRRQSRSSRGKFTRYGRNTLSESPRHRRSQMGNVACSLPDKFILGRSHHQCQCEAMPQSEFYKSPIRCFVTAAGGVVARHRQRGSSAPLSWNGHDCPML